MINKESWIKEYRKDKTKIWYIINDLYYFSDYNDWMKIKNQNILIESISLQYRSNKISEHFTDCDGVYLIRSIIGRHGGDIINTITIGKIVNNYVNKTVYVLPALIKKEEYQDSIENCFEEAIIYNDKSRKAKVVQSGISEGAV